MSRDRFGGHREKSGLMIQKFIIDSNVEQKIIDFLENHDLITVHSYSKQLSDYQLTKLAIEQQRWIISNDKDFIGLYQEASVKFNAVIFRVLDPGGLNQKNYHMHKINALKVLLSAVTLPRGLTLILINYSTGEIEYKHK